MSGQAIKAVRTDEQIPRYRELREEEQAAWRGQQ